MEKELFLKYSFWKRIVISQILLPDIVSHLFHLKNQETKCHNLSMHRNKPTGGHLRLCLNFINIQLIRNSHYTLHSILNICSSTLKQIFRTKYKIHTFSFSLYKLCCGNMYNYYRYNYSKHNFGSFWVKAMEAFTD